MNDDTLIADLVRAGMTDPDLLQRVANLMSACVHGLSTDKEDKRRERDRERKRQERETQRLLKEAAKANDVATVRGQSTDTTDKRCDLSFFLSSEKGLSTRKKEPSSRNVALAKRGTRISHEWQLSEADRQFARDQGMVEAAIDAALAEFIDYWVSVPGQRGTKLDWSATWRNRVRQVGTIGKGNGQNKSVLAAFDRLEQTLAGADDHTSSPDDLLRLSSR